MHLPPFSFFLSVFSVVVGLGCAHGSRNSVEYARRRDFDTLCSVSEGSVRRFHEARFLSPRVLRLFPSSSRTQKRTLLPVYKRTSINVTPVVVSLVCGSRAFRRVPQRRITRKEVCAGEEITHACPAQKRRRDIESRVSSRDMSSPRICTKEKPLPFDLFASPGRRVST